MMDIFWQIAIVEFLLNLAIFSSTVMAYGAIPSLMRHLPARMQRLEGASVGVLFGLATVGALLQPIHMTGGATIGGQTVLLELAGPIAGFSGALCAGLISLGVALFQWMQGTSLAATEIGPSMLSVAVGLALHALLRHGKSDLGYRHLPTLGTLLALAVLADHIYWGGWSVVAGSFAPVLLSSVSATLILGTLLLHERRRHVAERKLRDSEMRLAGQTVELAVARDAAEAASRVDQLTGLANRRVFVEALDHEIARARRDGSSFAVIYLDLDHFKDVNDTLGHPVGDLLLQRVADRLRASVRAVDTVARFGGDEFALILTDIPLPGEDVASVGQSRDIADPARMPGAAAIASGVADKIRGLLSEPFQLERNDVRTGASIGIAVYGTNSPDAESMLSHADVALYRAKADGRGTARFFTDDMEVEVRARVDMTAELRRAIDAEEFYLAYQPQVAVESGRIVGLEALVRWHHPMRGEVGPDEFIRSAEKSGLIVALGQCVLHQACRQTRAWLDEGVAPPLVAVNISSIQFKMHGELESSIRGALAVANLPASFIELELTEGVLMEASREHNDTLVRLRRAGHRIAIDDFGSGYSSLDYLRRFPVDRIKIAQTFIGDIGKVAGNDAIVRAALGLARELGIEVVVEGVETAAQLQLLKAWGARIVQGYYFARPLPASEITKLLRAGRIFPPLSDEAKTAAAANLNRAPVAA